jgi:hypothetical protein
MNPVSRLVSFACAPPLNFAHSQLVGPSDLAMVVQLLRAKPSGLIVKGVEMLIHN